MNFNKKNLKNIPKKKMSPLQIIQTLGITLLLIGSGVLASNPNVYSFPSVLTPSRAASLPASLSPEELEKIPYYEDVLSPVQSINKDILNRVIDKYGNKQPSDYADPAIIGDQKPKDVSLVVIQSEAYTNFNRYPSLKLSENVNTVFEEYRNAGIGGRVSVPVVGGMTCDTEYEFLTGLHALNMALIPYDTAIFTPQPSLAWDLRSLGYRVTGIHPYERTFFRRNEVYPFLGINNFYSMESMKNPRMISGYVSDEECFDRVLAQLHADPKENQFIFNVTMQNHAPFTFKPAEDMVQIQGVPKADKESLENLATGIKYTDKALKTFMEKIKSMDKHVIVVFYGDHLFSKEHKIFDKPEFTDNPHRMYQTDYFIYDNKNLKGIQKDMSIVEMSRYVKSMMMPLNNVDKFVLRNFHGPEKYTGATIRSTVNSPTKNIWAYITSLMNDPKEEKEVDHLFGTHQRDTGGKIYQPDQVDIPTPENPVPGNTP